MFDQSKKKSVALDHSLPSALESGIRVGNRVQTFEKRKRFVTEAMSDRLTTMGVNQQSLFTDESVRLFGRSDRDVSFYKFSLSL